MKLPALVLFLCCLLRSSSALAADGFRPLTEKSTVNDFALQCQHPGLKSNPDQRITACADELRRAREKVGNKKRSHECWTQLEKVSFIPIFDAMFSLAATPQYAKDGALDALEEIYFVVSPRCE